MTNNIQRGNNIIGIIATPTKWGWLLDGNEVPFTQCLCAAWLQTQPSTFKYLEIGVGSCQTMAAVCRIAEQFQVPSRVIGIELPSDPFKMRYFAPPTLWPYWCGEYHSANWRENLPIPSASLLFKESKEAFAEELKDEMFHAVFIDACHCYEHTYSDFLQAEPHIIPGGVVIFHDASPICQKNDPQTFHNPERQLEVRRAIADLGLLENKRPGWERMFDAVLVPHGIFAARRKPIA